MEDWWKVRLLPRIDGEASRLLMYIAAHTALALLILPVDWHCPSSAKPNSFASRRDVHSVLPSPRLWSHSESYTVYVPCLRCPTLWSAASDSLRLRSLQVGGWDPALVVGIGASSNSWPICPDNRYLLAWVHRLGAAGRSFRALATLAAALLLREQRGDPSVVDEEAGSSKSGEQEEVQENTACD